MQTIEQDIAAITEVRRELRRLLKSSNPDEVSRRMKYSTAIHEASHYVVFRRLFPDARCTSLQVIDEANGRISHKGLKIGNDRRRQARSAAYSLAGYAGEMELGLHTRKFLVQCCATDFTKADKTIRDLGLDPNRLFRASRRYVADEWDVIEEVAKALVTQGKLTGKEAAEIYSAAKSKTKNKGKKHANRDSKSNRIKRVRGSHV